MFWPFTSCRAVASAKADQPSAAYVILAGGLTAANVGRAIMQVRPAGVDPHTGVEESDGAKDPSLVRAFVEESRKAFALLKRNETAS